MNAYDVEYTGRECGYDQDVGNECCSEDYT